MTNTNPHDALKGLTAEEFLDVLEKASPDQLQAIAMLGQQARVSSALLPRWFSNMLAAPRRHSNVLSILGWWERRRLAYNLLVGLCGLLTISILGLGFGMPVQMLLTGALLYGGAANLCYTLGAPAESIAWLLWRDKANHLGPILLSLGTIFSACLTLGIGFILIVARLALGSM